MTKGRATTWQERIDNVLYCLANGQDYTKAASQFHVSYEQVYSWVKKYEAGGEEALRDAEEHENAWRAHESRSPQARDGWNTRMHDYVRRILF